MTKDAMIREAMTLLERAYALLLQAEAKQRLAQKAIVTSNAGYPMPELKRTPDDSDASEP